MQLNVIVEKLEKELKQLFQSESSGHDIHHLKRTMNLSLKIQESEGGDRLVVGVSSLLHDIHRIIEKETGVYCTPKQSLTKIKEIIEKSEIELSAEQISKILHCIEFHEEYNFSTAGKTVNDLETLILQDADNLEASGAIGIGRTFAFGGAHSATMWDPEVPLGRNIYNDSINDTSTINHFYSKLLKLKDNMNTLTAKEMANERHKFMELFLKEFFDEWNGQK